MAFFGSRLLSLGFAHPGQTETDLARFPASWQSNSDVRLKSPNLDHASRVTRHTLAPSCAPQEVAPAPFQPGVSASLIQAARKLAAAVGRLKFSAPVTYVYNPLDYAWPLHEAYLRTYCRAPKQIIFLGMNPGPFGMAQTGVPFGEVRAVREWLKLKGPVGKPLREHPRRLVTGLQCRRSEVSGQRLWGLFAERFGDSKSFFSRHFVLNYCPLAFLEASGRNRTPDKLPPRERTALFAACDAHLRRAVEILQPQWLIGVGGFAHERAHELFAGTGLKLGCILHPSPANPAANRGWASLATNQLRALGVWD
jgi:single-strand selective monofunctional uracil DNA glycosylase